MIKVDRRYQTTLRAKLRIEDINELRKRMKIGDIVTYQSVKARVVARYPHLVEVVPIGQSRCLPIRTMTYTEIAMMERGFKWEGEE